MLDDIFLLIMLASIPVMAVSAVMFFIRLITKKNRKRAKRTFWIAVACCIGSFILFGVTSPATRCKHEFSTIVDEAPTCITDGKKEQYCPLCDYTKREELEATGHTMIPIRKLEPSYEEEGELIEKCSTCGYEVITKIEKLTKPTEPANVGTTESTSKETVASIEAQAETLKHEWQDATCSLPKTCSICNETEGNPLGHTWSEATCTAPKTCSVCGETDGKALEHNYDDWIVEIEATISQPGKMIRHCTVCQRTDSKSYQLESYIVDNKFIFTPDEFQDRFFDIFQDFDYAKFGGAQVREKDGQVMVSIVDNGYNNVGNIGFVSDKNTMRMAASKTESNFDGVMMIISAPEEFVANAILAVIMSTNPTISEYGARQVAKSVLEEQTSYEGVTYTFSVIDNYYTLMAVANFE